MLLRSRTARIRLFVLAIVTAVGCAGQPDGSLSPGFRLIESDPQAQFAREAMIESIPVFTWNFRDPADVEAWQLNVDRSKLEVDAHGLRILEHRRFITLTSDVTLEAEEVDAFELRVKGLPRHAVELTWAGPDQHFSNDRKVRTELGRPALDGFRVYRLVTGGHPRWQGKISRLAFKINVAKDRNAVIDSIRGLAERVLPGAVEEAVNRPWKVALGDDVRNSILAVPGVPIRRRLEVPAGAQLWLGYGTQRRVRGALRFRVSAVRSNGTQVELLDVPSGEPGRWYERAIDLAPVAGATVDLELLVEGESDFDSRLGFPVWANVEVVSPRRRVPPNVVLISIDTLRSDRLSLYGHSRITSPHLDAWADGAVVFERTVAPSPWTLPSHISLFTGVNAHRHGLNFNTPAPSELVTLAEMMRAAGYATLAVTGGGFVHPQYGFAQGFDCYRSFSAKMGAEEELAVGIEGALDLVDRYRDRPFLLFFHTYEVHSPFRPRMPYFKQFTGRSEGPLVGARQGSETAENGFLDNQHRMTVLREGKPARLLSSDEVDLAFDLYDAGIAYTDAALGRLLARLGELGLDRRTIVVVTSDHGEMFGEHGLFNHMCLYDENLLVPLVISDPTGRGAGTRISEQVRSIDILPTLLELTGVERPPGIDGVSLVPLMDGHVLPPDAGLAWSYAPSSNFGLSVRDRNRFKLITRNDPWRYPGPPQQLFELGADPEEAQPVTGSVPDSERLSQLTGRVLANDIPGVRVRIASSPEGRTYRGALRGTVVPAHRLKTLNVGCGCVTHGGGKTTLFEVKPGEDVTLWLEGIGAGQLAVTVEPDGTARESIELVVDLAELDRVRQIAPTPTGWTAQQGDAPLEDGVSVWWHLQPEGVTGAPPEIDESLRDQLEALGYAN